MTLNYDSLGRLIEEVDIRNDGLLKSEVVGVSKDKHFIRSSLNNRGSLEKFKLIEYNQFAYSPVTSKNDNKISIALFKENMGLIPSSYIVFSIVESDKLNPDYLMLFFERSDFDRYALFYSYGSDKEVFTWDRLCETKIPLPSIEVQDKIVDIIRVIEKRIGIKERISQILEEMIQSIFGEFFVTFEHFSSVNFKQTEIGEIPEEWDVVGIGEKIECILGDTPRRDNPEYWGGNIPWINSSKVNEFRILDEVEGISEFGLENSSANILPLKTTVVALSGVGLGQVSLLEISSCTNQSVIGLIQNREFPYEFIYPFIKENISDIVMRNGKRRYLNKRTIESCLMICPTKEAMSNYKNIVSPLFDRISINCLEIEKLKKFRGKIISGLIFGKIDVSSIRL